MAVNPVVLQFPLKQSPAAVANAHLDSGTAMGANLIANGATFRVWGGGAREVHILGSFIGWTPSEDTRLLSAGNGQWWGFVPGAKDRDHYKFWVVGEAGGAGSATRTPGRSSGAPGTASSGIRIFRGTTRDT